MNAFVDYVKDELTKTINVVKTKAEKIDCAIDAYRTNNQIADQTKEILEKNSRISAGPG